MKTNATIFTKKLGALLLCGTLLTGSLAIHAGAVSQINAQLTPSLTILVDGTERTFYNVNGNEVHPILYHGTTYLPVRAIGELMGKNVDWNEATHTVTLSGTRTTPAVTGTPDTSAQTTMVSAQIRDDFTIIVDGQVRTFYNVNGTQVYPLLYHGSTYLPLRSIGELMGKTVSWDSATSTASLTSSSLVTDADSFSGGSGTTTTPTNPTTPPTSSTNSMIGVEAAKSIALSDAGLSASQVTFVQQHLDWDDGRHVYDIEFYTSDYKEYDYEIDAYTGTILSRDYDADHYTRPTTPTGGSDIGVTRAKEIALGQVSGATSSNIVQAKLDRDDGRLIYEVKIIYNTWEYEFEIDAYTGTILSWDTESIYD